MQQQFGDINTLYELKAFNLFKTEKYFCRYQEFHLRDRIKKKKKKEKKTKKNFIVFII